MTKKLVFCLALFAGHPYAQAYVSGATGLPANSVEISAKTEFMGGLAGPETKPETQQVVVPSITIYELGAGYSFGSLCGLQDVKVRVSGMFFDSAPETLRGAPIYSRDEGGVLGLEVGANFIHDPDKIFGVFLRSQNPVDMNIGKFANPKIDRLGIGVQAGYKFAENFGQETLLFFGSGVSGGGFKQNASLSISVLSAAIFNDFALKLGPFFEGDLGERNDLAYGTQGVRAFRLGFVGAITYSLTPKLVLDLAYIQKVTGAYFRATKDGMIAIRLIL